MRVRLIPTGRCELLGLSACLERLFPGHTFDCVAAREEPDGERVPFDGFTSGRLSRSLVPGNLAKLVQQLAAEVHPGRHGEPADMAVLLDDLELENLDQADVVVAAVRAAVGQHLAELARRVSAATARRVEEALRDRASFHLVAPMVEAWFFADPEVLPTAGVPAERLPPRLRSGVDPEAFETDDAAFSMDDGAACATLNAQNARRRKQERPPWMLPSRPDLSWYRRERHPKAYLAWLCRDAQDKRCSSYRESRGGAAALAALDWRRLLHVPAHCAFARAFLADLADALGSPVPDLDGGAEHPLVARANAPQARVLRNL